MLFKKSSLFLMVFLFCTCLIAVHDLTAKSDKKVSIMAARKEKSNEYARYQKIIDDKQILNQQDYDKLSFDDMKELADLAIVSQLKNPYEFFNDKHQTGQYYNPISSFLFVHKNFINWEYNYKHIYKDIYHAPYVIIGRITDKEVVQEETDPTQLYYQIIKYKAQILDYVSNNIHIVDEDDIEFLFSTGWRIKRHYLHGQNLEIGKMYLLFISVAPYDFSGHPDNRLPSLKITSKGNEYFEIIDNVLLDPREYFGKGTMVDVTDVKTIFRNIMDDIYNGRSAIK